MTFEKPTVFASDEWCTIPFLGREKSAFDSLGDILLQFPSAYILRNRLRVMRDQYSDEFGPTRQSLEAKAMDLTARLSNYWVTYRTLIDSVFDHARFVELFDLTADLSTWTIETPPSITFKSTLAATNIAMYDAAVIHANALAWEANPRDAEINKRKIIIHCASILAAVAYHENRGIGSGSTISMIFPMKTVSRITPSDDQRRQVLEALERWGERRGVKEACEFARVNGHDIYSNICKMEMAQAGANCLPHAPLVHHLDKRLVNLGYRDIIGC